MPEYLAPGVYIEEIGAGPQPIEGVPTSTAGFVGPARQGPPDAASPPLSSFVEFEHAYGDGTKLAFAGSTPSHNYLWHAVRAFFEEGGKRVYIARVFRSDPGNAPDGAPPTPADYDQALSRLAPIDEISLVAAPGGRAVGPSVTNALITHAESLRYRIAILDGDPQQTPEQVRAMANEHRSSRAVLYHPWIHVADPQEPAGLALPPSGFLAGVYARSDAEHGVWKAPAGQPIARAIGLATDLDDAEQQTLNDSGVNCLRKFPARGIVVWGARTLSTALEWKYLSVRRLFLYLERSIETGIRWAVLEPDADGLTLRVGDAVRRFLDSVWRAGALQGATPEEAYVVRCEADANYTSRGPITVLVGAAPLKPAEFVFFRVVVMRADEKR